MIGVCVSTLEKYFRATTVLNVAYIRVDEPAGFLAGGRELWQRPEPRTDRAVGTRIRPGGKAKSVHRVLIVSTTWWWTGGTRSCRPALRS